jgi:formamidopyrimidine-DNA glycosylase
MPEMLEIEMYRRGMTQIVGRSVAAVEAPDDWYLKGTDGAALRSMLTGATISGLDRVGKLLLMETTAGTIGLRFGMTGIPVVDQDPVLAELEYSSKRLDPAWDRFAIDFVGGGRLAMNDPRRLGGVEIEPDLTKLGPDAWQISHDNMSALFARYRVATKALLLNQKRIAGLGNLLVDELLWRSGVSPLRPANEVSAEAVATLATNLGPMLDELYERGGSTCGDHFPERSPDGHCPQDGAPMVHDEVGGRSTWWCRKHQS